MSDRPDDPFDPLAGADEARPDWGLIARHLSGDSSDEDEAALRAWVATDPLRARLLVALRDAWIAADADPAVAHDATGFARGVWADIRGRERARSTVGPVAGRQPTATRAWAHRRYWIVGVAAALVIAGAGIATMRRGASHRALAEYATANAERATVTLLDGTHVVLAPASRIRVALRSDRGARDVYLDGEAMFTVRHDAARPFTVHTASAETRDVGTAFGVRAYVGEGGTRVVVGEGRVALRSETTSHDSTVLGAGELGRVGENGALAPVERVSIDDYLGWVNGRLVFDYTPLGEALPEIGRWYGLDVRLADSTLADRRISATFTTESPTQVLAMLGASLGLRFDRSGQVVTVRRP